MIVSDRVTELQQLGRQGDELEEMYGFVVENDPTELHLMCSGGLQVKDSEYNTLGYNKMGVYLCKHADVCLQHALIKFSGSPVIRMLIFKVSLQTQCLDSDDTLTVMTH